MSQTESIIGADGSLNLSVDKVTWFSFLQMSRSTNSEKHGWNSKTHWSQRGLDCLAAQTGPKMFLSAWTRQSLADDALPVVRRKDFKFIERKKAQGEGVRGKKGTPREGSENLINWRFAREQRIPGIVSAYEVPLSAERKGQLKADVMLFHGGGRIEIVELKRNGETNPDPPLMALTEATCYALQTKRCWPHLVKELPNAKPGEELTAIHLILAAPGYWDKCNEAGRITQEQVSKLGAIVSAVGAELPGVTLSLSVAEIGEDGLNIRRIDESPEPPDWSILALHKKAHSLS